MCRRRAPAKKLADNKPKENPKKLPDDSMKKHPPRMCRRRAPAKKLSDKIPPQIMCGRRAPTDNLIDDPQKIVSSASPTSDEKYITPQCLSLDLMQSAQEMLQFLEQVDKHRQHIAVTNDGGKHLNNLFNRYKLWLTIRGELSAQDRIKFDAPLDICFFWLAHKIRTNIFLRDLKTLGFDENTIEAFNNESWKPSGSGDEDFSKNEWTKRDAKSSWTFEDDQTSIVSLNFDKISFELQDEWICEDTDWLPSLKKGWPQYESNTKSFLEGAMRDYLDWLAKQKEIDENTDLTGPPIDIDIFWHAHIIHTEKYVNDLKAILGFVFFHQPQADYKTSKNKINNNPK